MPVQKQMVLKGVDKKENDAVGRVVFDVRGAGTKRRSYRINNIARI